MTTPNTSVVSDVSAVSAVLTHKDLYSTNDDYCPELNHKLKLLYQGGFAIQKEAGLFLEQMNGLETSSAYKERLKAVSYLPYLSEFVTQFTASLFSEELEVKPPPDAEDTTTQGEDVKDNFYKSFMQNCDLNGRSFHQFMQDCTEVALTELCAYPALDFPRPQEGISRLIEETDVANKGKAFVIPYNIIIDWKIDAATGKFIWVKMFEDIYPDNDPYSVASQLHYYQFKIWTMREGVGYWEEWQSELMPAKRSFTNQTKYTLKNQGTTSFQEIPIFCFSIDKGYHVGQQIGPLCQEHYQRRSFMVSNSNKTCVGLGVITLGPEITAPGDALPLELPGLENYKEPRGIRGKLESEGWIVLRKTDKWSDDIKIVEASGASHKFVSEELQKLVEAMMQTLRQMQMTARANMKSLGRSAASKAIDSHGTSMLLSVYERCIKDFVKKFFMCLSAGRKEYIEWDIDGLSTAEPVKERKEVIEEYTAMKVDYRKLPSIFKKKYLFRLASELLEGSLDDREKYELQEDIEKLVDEGEFDWEPEPLAMPPAKNKPAPNSGE